MTTREETPAATVAVGTDVAALAAGLVTVTAWGSAFVGIRAAGETLSPGALALGRLIVSLAILGTVAAVRRERLPARRDLLWIATFGVLWLAVYSVALNEAERRVDAGTAAMLVNTGPILIAIFAGIFLREGFPPGLFAGCAVAFCGVVVIAFATAQSGARSGLGVVLCIVAAFAYAVAVVVQKPVLARVSAFQVTWIGLAAATIACLPFAPTLATEAANADAGTIAWIVYLGAVPTALGFAIWGFALRRTSAGRMGSLTYLAPPIAIVLGWAVLGETPPWLAAAGGALCLGGVALARSRPRLRKA
jgi:drug/metabolite transporter (DMT)-like permease